MNAKFRVTMFLSIVVLFTTNVTAQILNPVHWSYATKKTSPTEAVVFLKATIDKGWHIYSQTVKDGGPVKTSFTFAKSKHYTLIGKTSEPKPVSIYEKNFNMNVAYFENETTFQQKVKLTANKAIVTGILKYATCNDHQCLPPETVSFSININ